MIRSVLPRQASIPVLEPTDNALPPRCVLPRAIRREPLNGDLSGLRDIHVDRAHAELRITPPPPAVARALAEDRIEALPTTVEHPPTGRAILNTLAVDLGKAAVTTGVNTMVHWLTFDAQADEGKGDATIASTKAVVITTVAAAATGYALAKGFKALLSPYAYQESQAGRISIEGQMPAAVCAGRAVMHPAVRYVIAGLSGCAGLLSAMSGIRSIGSSKDVYTVIAAMTPAITDTLFDYAVKPYLTTYKTSPGLRSQLNSVFIKLAPTALVPITGDGLGAIAANLMLRGGGGAIIMAVAGPEGTVEAPKARESFKALTGTMVDKCAINASVGFAGALLTKLGQSGVPSKSAQQGAELLDEVRVGELAAGAGAVLPKALKGVVENQIAKQSKRRHEVQEGERRASESRAASTVGFESFELTAGRLGFGGTRV